MGHLSQSLGGSRGSRRERPEVDHSRRWQRLVLGLAHCLLQCRGAALPLPQIAQPLSGHPCVRQTLPQATATTTQSHLPRLPCYLASSRYDTVLRRYLRVVRTYRDSQPEAVATLRRDFRSTISYYHIEQQFPAWDRKHLCTTSRLERFNRTIRRRARAASAYHSDQGLLAMVAQEAHEFHVAQRDK